MASGTDRLAEIEAHINLYYAEWYDCDSRIRRDAGDEIQWLIEEVKRLREELRVETYYLELYRNEYIKANGGQRTEAEESRQRPTD